MSRLIDADALAEKKFQERECNGLGEGPAYRQGWNDAIDAVMDNEPSAQPEPIKVSVDREMTEEELKELKKKIADSPVVLLPSAQPERTCVNCGRTANNGGWYADGRTRCPIEEHYALPKDGYCHLWEKRSVTDDDYPERRTDE